jgi:hypothetical protein
MHLMQKPDIANATVNLLRHEQLLDVPCTGHSRGAFAILEG